MNSLRLLTEAKPGTRIDIAIKDAIKLSSKLGIDVEFKFNGVTMYINAKSIIEEKKAYYHKTSEATNAYKN